MRSALPTSSSGISPLDKNFRIPERARLQFRAEFFNLPNHTNFGIPNTKDQTPPSAPSAPPIPSRQVQFALKLLF